MQGYCTLPSDPRTSGYFKDKMLLMQAHENGVALNEEQLLFLAGGQDNVVDEDGLRTVHDFALNVDNVFQADDCDAFDSDVDEASTAQTMFMAISSPIFIFMIVALSPSYDSEILSEKENKYLEEFLDMKALKEKLEDKIYKTPYAYSCAQQVQPALYNGHEIIKTNHVPAIVHNSEDTLEIAEITRKKMNNKMKDLECVKKEFKIAPPDYSKENYLATFTPQKQLTLKQIFWSNDLIEMKAEALKEQTKASRQIKALTMYPPNTPATLVPRALTKEIKEMKDIFEELEAEVDQNVVHRKHAEIERKNLLIVNDNLIADYLSKDVFYITMNSELTLKIQTDDHNELVNRFSNLEVNHLNLQLKYQNLKESFGNNPPLPARETPDFDSVFVIGKMKASLQGKDNPMYMKSDIATYGSVKTKSFTPNRYAIDVEPFPHHNRNNWEVYPTLSQNILRKGYRGSNLYTISVEDMMKSSPIYLLSKASKNKSWLWHRRLNHLNFDTINDLARKDLVRGLPRLKFEKDHLCFACQLGKSKKHTHTPKAENTNLEVLNTLHMGLCGPIRVQTVNGKKYILVIVDDYSRFTWVKFLKSKDETPEVVIKFLKQKQIGLNKTAS
ncbi:retrovirus-related pol polyprotein from transposon TNT 1-94 [Tanacetum coccineum]